MNIAICDDDVNFCQTLFKMVQVYLQNANLDAQLHIFASVEELCQAIQHKQIALVFLDIELTGMNGVDAGHILRHSQHSDVQIIYVFAKEEYSMQLFQNRSFDFLVKPISQNRLRMLIDEYFRIFPQEERYSFDNTDYELLFLTLCGAKLVLSLLTESYYRRREKERISHQMELYRHQMELFVGNYASVVFHHRTLICPSYIERAFHDGRLFLNSVIF